MQGNTSVIFVYLMVIALIGCTAASRESEPPTSKAPLAAAYTLDGKPLYPPQESAAAGMQKDSLLRIAEVAYKKDSLNLQNIIWYGRRLAYLSRYPEAIAVYSNGLKGHPASPELLRHRGHRYITVRKFNEAVADLQQAAISVRGRPVEIEPDGIPNKLNTPLSNLHFNIWYHLGLAHYLKREYDKAAVAYDSCMKYSVNPDLVCATTDWYYMTLMRAGRKKEAAILLDRIDPGMSVIENDGYLQRLLLYKGLVKPESLIRFDQLNAENELTVVTQGYGVSFYYETLGDTIKAKEIRQRILDTSYWSAFGYIAAESDLMN